MGGASRPTHIEMTRVKICGITNLDDAMLAVDAGADALGFIFVEDTPRFVTPENVARAVATARPYAVDVNSGVEAQPGRKDPDKVWRFVAEAKGVR